MSYKKYPPTKDRRDIGQVVFLSEKMNAARDYSSCCVGVEASLEVDARLKNLVTHAEHQNGYREETGGHIARLYARLTGKIPGNK